MSDIGEETPPSPKERNLSLAVALLIVGLLLGAAVAYVPLSQENANLKVQIATFQTENSRLLTNITALNTQVIQLQNNFRDLNLRFYSLRNDYDTLSARYNGLETQYITIQNNFATWQSLHVGTTLETYYEYVRANSITFGLLSMGEENWWIYPNYYNLSVTFTADLASHDIGNLWWPALDNACAYYNYTSEYSYQTSSRIMDQAMILANISHSDSDAMKIDKVLAFINSIVHYENRMIDHMWFPCETLAFRSGDCTSFSILAAAMFERAGIKSAIAFFTNSTLGHHSMVLVHIDNLGSYTYWYYDDLTSYGLPKGKWIIIEPQFNSLAEYEARHYNWISYWSLVACAEIPYGP